MTLTEVLPAQTSSPRNAMTWTPAGPAAGRLVVDTRTARAAYDVQELPLPPEEAGSRAFRLDKRDAGADPEGDLYTVLLTPDPRGDECDCKGFIFGRGKPCKHVLACRALVENRWV